MNKKFSTLVATLLLSGALFTLDAAATSLTEFDKTEGVEMAADGLSLKLTADVSLADQKAYLLIDKDNFVLDGNSKKFTGHIVITGKNVTVKNLTVDYKNVIKEGDGIDGTITINKTAISAYTEGVTISNCIINCSSDLYIANGITVYPKTADAKIKIEKVTVNNANKENGGDYSSAILVAQGMDVAASFPNVLEGEHKAALLKDFNVAEAIVGCTFKNCAADYSIADWSDINNPSYSAARFTLMENKSNKAQFVKFVKGAADDASIVFNGTKEQLAEALGDTEVPNVAITTNDGPVVSGMPQLDEKVVVADNGFEFVSKPSASEYYRLFHKGGDNVMYLVTINPTTKQPELKGATSATETDLTDNSLFKMEVKQQGHDSKYTFTFESKSGLPLLFGATDSTFVESNWGYTVNGAVFDLNGTSLETMNAGLRYFGLYKAGLHTMTAGELNFIEDGGFSITIKPEGLVGNPFSGKLAPMTWDATNKKFVKTEQSSTATEYYLKNEDGDYIVAKLFGAEGGNKDDAYYVFATASEEDLIADLKATKNENRKLFGEFKTFYKPVGAHDDMEKIERIDSMEVKVLAQDKTIKFAPVGYANISTTDKTEKTLTASLESAQYPISFTMGNNVVDPKTIVKGKFVTITKIMEEGNKIYAATDCSGEGAWVEAVGNDLEAQWAITYDTDKNEYTLTNRENLDVKKDGIKKNLLREDDNNKDNIYLFDGDVVKIEAIDVEESDGYKWLGEVDSKLFKMAHWSGVHGAQAWMTTNEDGYALVNIDESKAINIAADAKVDTARVESVLGYFDGNDYKTKKNMLKVPVYVFKTADRASSLGLENGKYMFDQNADTLAIREDAGHYNLRVVGVADKKPVMECAKVYASLSPSDDASYLKKANGLYIETTNDLFDVVDNDAPLYRRFNSLELEGNEGDLADTLRFYEKYRNEYLQVENNKNFMVDGIKFLGIYTPDFTKDGKSFIVDTAWVGRSKGEKKPQYLISINRQDQAFQAGEMCPVCQEIVANGGTRPANCPHDKAGKLPFHFGEYLVNFADSAKNEVNGEDYKWKGYTRAGFVKAAHQGDSLFILTGQFADVTVATFDSAKIKKAVADKKYDKKYIVNLTGDNHKLVTWSMRFVDPANAANEVEEDRAFLMESVAAKGQPDIAPSKASWLKMQNGCLVLSGSLDGSTSSFDQFTDDDDALIFNVEKGNKEDLATDNEEIATSEVTVIAGEGNVTIANAAGKKVVVSNILGQVVVNTVLASDNATIAAPQGVVVVAVEGEEAVKAIVK